MEISVCAVTDASKAVEHALAAQEVPPLATVGNEDGLGDGLRRGLQAGTDWLWLLDRSAPPRPRALSALVDALDRTEGLPHPVLLAGVVLGPNRRVDQARTAWYRSAPTEPAMAAVERRLLPIRAAAGPLLIHRSVVYAGSGPRRGLTASGALLEWTARKLRDKVGYLVADSEHDLVVRGRSPAADPLTAAALMLGGGFGGIERVKLIRDLLEGVVTASRGRTGHPIA